MRSVFKDLVHLAADGTGRTDELYVIGQRPVKWLQSSTSTAAWALDRGAASTRVKSLSTFGDLDTSVAAFTAGPAVSVRVIDLEQRLPELFAS